MHPGGQRQQSIAEAQVTSHPTSDNAGAWWLVCGKGRRLHGVPAAAISTEQMRDALDKAVPVTARAVCGLRRGWWMPGLFSRLARTRCTPCCRALGIEPGYGTPANEADIKEKEATGADAR
jgi:hypothetical protein